jgi:hypothetical protein
MSTRQACTKESARDLFQILFGGNGQFRSIRHDSSIATLSPIHPIPILSKSGCICVPASRVRIRFEGVASFLIVCHHSYIQARKASTGGRKRVAAGLSAPTRLYRAGRRCPSELAADWRSSYDSSHTPSRRLC